MKKELLKILEDFLLENEHKIKSDKNFKLDFMTFYKWLRKTNK